VSTDVSGKIKILTHLIKTICQNLYGRVSRKQPGEKSNLPPLRLWQLIQQALTGMVVALMKQPKMPVKGTPAPSDILVVCT
jgi:hypothetical protein